MERTRKIVFSAPVMVDGKPVTELIMREATVGDQIDAVEMCGQNAAPAKVEAMLFAVLCGVSFEDMRRLHGWQYSKLQDAFVFLAEEPSSASPPATSGGQS